MYAVLPASSTSPCGAEPPLWQHQRELLLESTGEGVLGIDLEGHCTFINRAGAGTLGWTLQEVLGRNRHTLTHHSHVDGPAYPAHDYPIFNAFRQGLSCCIDAEVFWRSDQSAFPVAYASYPLPRERTRAGLHHLDGDYALRNHSVDFWITRAVAH